ncbi:uncharacterized protein LOC34623762 [Cyclospora cayetanensis]|uniref:Uncharacterized protein LOC34623762 n=1 Tax=Cyclospora cayetanensis TaxID=88456 RepID=A0A6P6RVK6_9EIME|nr:uncharacterized protein LOC34623762 [Cyclospora cayetanensis]
MGTDIEFNFADGTLDLSFLGTKEQLPEQHHNQLLLLQRQPGKRKHRQGAGVAAAAASTSAAARSLQQQNKRLVTQSKIRERHLQLLRKDVEEQQQHEPSADEDSGFSRVACISKCVNTRKQQLNKDQLQIAAEGGPERKKRKKKSKASISTRRPEECPTTQDTQPSSVSSRYASSGTASDQSLLPSSAKMQAKKFELASQLSSDPTVNKQEKEAHESIRPHEGSAQQQAQQPKDECYALPHRMSRIRHRRLSQQRLEEDHDNVREGEHSVEACCSVALPDIQAKQQQQLKIRGKTKGGRSIFIRKIFNASTNSTQKRTKTRSKQKNIKNDNRPDSMVRKLYFRYSSKGLQL